MKGQSQWVVIYKDSTDARNLYFGPFVSDTLASTFMGSLPNPMAGGSKTYKQMSPFEYDEIRLACEYIMRARGVSKAPERLMHYHH